MSGYDLSGLRPTIFKGGSLADYLVEVTPNGTLGTRHLGTGKFLPNVGIAEGIEQAAEKAMGVLGVANPMGMAAAGIGLLNLGVSAWTAWKVSKLSGTVERMDGKLDHMADHLRQVDHKVDGLHSFLHSSTDYLSRLIQTNAVTLGLMLENQNDIAAGIAQLRHELAAGVRSVHDAITNSDAQREAFELEQQMRALLGYYEVCSRDLQAGKEPAQADLRAIIDGANSLIAWIDTRLRATRPGAPERLPRFVARAFALRLELDARELLDEGAGGRESAYARLRSAIAEELEALIKGTPLCVLATELDPVIEDYVFLHRSLRGRSTIVELPDGGVEIYVSKALATWDDGLSSVRSLVAPAQESVAALPARLELTTLDEHRGWRRLSGQPRGASDEVIELSELGAALGLRNLNNHSEDALRQLLRNAPIALDTLDARIKREVAA